MPRVVILGLGVSGLGCAVELARRGIPFLAFEKEDRAGGLARTDSAGGFPFDRGPHILLSAPPEIDRFLATLDGLDLTACSARSGIALDGDLQRVIPAPFQRHLNHLPLAERARLLPGILRAGRRSHPPANYAEYVIGRCGRGVYDLFLRGYDSKRLRFPLDRLPPDWSNRIEATSLASLFGFRANGGGQREDRFRYPREGGIEALPKAMARLLPADSARYRHSAVEFRPEAKEVVFANGETVSYDCLVTSLPLPETLAAIRAPPPEIRRAAESLHFTSVFVVNAAIEAPPPEWSLLRVPSEEVGFYRLSFPSRYCARRAPAGSTAVVGEIAHHAVRYPLTSDQAKEQFRGGLERLAILRRGQPVVFHAVHDIRYGHVIYDHGTAASVQRILEYLRGHAIFPCGKYGLWKDLLIPQSILSGMEAARAIAAEW